MSAHWNFVWSDKHFFHRFCTMIIHTYIHASMYERMRSFSTRALNMTRFIIVATHADTHLCEQWTTEHWTPSSKSKPYTCTVFIMYMICVDKLNGPLKWKQSETMKAIKYDERIKRREKKKKTNMDTVNKEASFIEIHFFFFLWQIEIRKRKITEYSKMSQLIICINNNNQDIWC